MASSKSHFYDAANPRNIASGLQAAYYVNGYKWSQADIDRMSRVFGVSVLPEAYWAHLARAIDLEQGAAPNEAAVPFVLERRLYLKEHYGRDFTDDSTCYVNRSNWPIVIHMFRDHGVVLPRFWVATLDGTWEVAEEGIDAWAVQGYGGPTAPYDMSIIHGRDDLHRP